MPAVEARTPQGTIWRVRVLWAPRRRDEIAARLRAGDPIRKPGRVRLGG